MASLSANFSTSSLMIQNESTSIFQGNQSGLTMNSPLLSQPFAAATFVVICVAIALLCILGNALVLLIVSRSTPLYPRITYVFLSNLAAADLMVGVFCVIPYMYNAVFVTWKLPHPLCKVYKFVETTSITVSILLLQVIALERFIAINYPLQAKRLFTNRKIRFAQVLVWITACFYGMPMLIIWDAHEISHGGVTKTYCYPSSNYIPIIKAYSFINLIMWYFLPLVFMTLLYCKIGLTLRKSQLTDITMDLRHRCPTDSREASGEPVTGCSSSGGAARQGANSTNLGTPSGTRSPRSTRTVVSKVKLWWKKRNLQIPEASGSIVRQACCSKRRRGSVNRASTSKRDSRDPEDNQETSFIVHSAPHNHVPQTFSFQENRGGDKRGAIVCMEPDHSSQDASGSAEHQGNLEEIPTGRRLSQNRRRTSASGNTQPPSGMTGAIPRCRLTTQYSSRRRAIRLLVVVVASFAILLFPLHFRKFLQMANINIRSFQILDFMAIISHLCLYMNSAINPILYTFVSQTFRRHLREAFCSCRSRTSRCIRIRRAHKSEVSSLPNTRNSFC